jgi:hypothetical protein
MCSHIFVALSARNRATCISFFRKRLPLLNQHVGVSDLALGQDVLPEPIHRKAARDAAQTSETVTPWWAEKLAVSRNRGVALEKAAAAPMT